MHSKIKKTKEKELLQNIKEAYWN